VKAGAPRPISTERPYPRPLGTYVFLLQARMHYAYYACGRSCRICAHSPWLRQRPEAHGTLQTSKTDGDFTMRLLHFCHDEKVIPFVQRLYEDAAPNSNEFRIWGPRPGTPSRHAKMGPTAKAVPNSYWFSEDLIRDVRSSDILVIHFLTPTFARAIRAASPEQIVVWCAWGADYYGLITGYSNRLLLPTTYRMQIATETNRKICPSTVIKQALRSPVTKLESISDGEWPESALERIDYLVIDQQSYRDLTRSQPKLRATRHWIPYYCIDDMPARAGANTPSKNILLGNSAAATNNHAEALIELSQIDLGGRNVIVPLSYGGTRKYVDNICSMGERLLGRAFVPITDFLSLDAYLEIVGTSAIVIMNHVRSQGVGNIVAALQYGAKVYLRPENHLTEFFQEHGIEIHAWHQGLKHQLLEEQSEKTRLDNYNGVNALFSYASALTSVKELLVQIDRASLQGLQGPVMKRSSAQLLLWHYNRLVELVKNPSSNRRDS
jgi:dTDP-N-acetylfucosamine:lipid II N-acetylfucosaminyltransferase